MHRTFTPIILLVLIKLKSVSVISQAWLDLESGNDESPIFESGFYPVIQTDLTKAMQSVETFMALINSREKQLENLRVESAELSSFDLLSGTEKCQDILNQVKRRYTNKLVS